MGAILTEIVELLGGGITGVATWIGSGLSSLVQNIFLTVSETGEVEGLSIFGGVIVIFAGIALAIGLSRMVVAWIQSLGN